MLVINILALFSWIVSHQQIFGSNLHINVLRSVTAVKKQKRIFPASYVSPT